MRRLLLLALLLPACGTDTPITVDASAGANMAMARDLAAADLARPLDLSAPPKGRSATPPDAQVGMWVASTCPGWLVTPAPPLSFTRNFLIHITLTVKNDSGKAGKVTGMRLTGNNPTQFGAMAPALPPLDVGAGGTAAFEVYFNPRKDAPSPPPSRCRSATAASSRCRCGGCDGATRGAISPAARPGSAAQELAGGARQAAPAQKPRRQRRGPVGHGHEVGI